MPRELPTFSVNQLQQTKATPELILPILEANPAPPVVWPFKRPITPMERLYRSRMVVADDYNPNRFIRQDERKIDSAQTQAIVNRILEEEETRRRRKRKSPTANVQIIETTPQAKARIMGLVGGRNTIGKTYRVGAVEATSVIPIRRTDPLWCVRNINSPTDGTMNRLFELAFFKAVAGKLDYDPTFTRQALNLGEIAATVALNTCLGGSAWTLAELFFIGEIAFSAEKYLVNGFD